LIAASGSLTGIIIVVIVGCLAAVSIVLHFRKQRRTSVVLQERRETIHRSLVEAFSSNNLDEDDGNRSFSTSHSQSYSRRTPATLQEDEDDEEDRPIMFRTDRDPA
jgi:FtsZ-interacting cell division protein ZipA